MQHRTNEENCMTVISTLAATKQLLNTRILIKFFVKEQFYKNMNIFNYCCPHLGIVFCL